MMMLIASDENKIRKILGFKRIAVVGLSDNPERPSCGAASYLRSHGFEIVPVNPLLSEWNGLKAYPDLRSIPFPVDVVDVFRKPEFASAIADDAIAIKAKALWLQEGITSVEAKAKAEAAGLLFVQDKCMMKEHARLRV